MRLSGKLRASFLWSAYNSKEQQLGPSKSRSANWNFRRLRSTTHLKASSVRTSLLYTAQIYKSAPLGTDRVVANEPLIQYGHSFNSQLSVIQDPGSERKPTTMLTALPVLFFAALATAKSYQIRSVQDPIYHYYLQALPSDREPPSRFDPSTLV